MGKRDGRRGATATDGTSWWPADPVGKQEVAERLGVKPATVNVWWSTRREMPDPDYPRVNDLRAWEWRTILRWAGDTYRLTTVELNEQYVAAFGHPAPTDGIRGAYPRGVRPGTPASSERSRKSAETRRQLHACKSCGNNGGLRYKTMLLHRDGEGSFARCACGWTSEPPSHDSSDHERQAAEHASGCVADAWFIDDGACPDCGRSLRRDVGRDPRRGAGGREATRTIGLATWPG